jgi:hypothetical protein
VTETRTAVRESCRLGYCTRPMLDERIKVCAEHHELFEAQASEEQWEFAEAVLRPWVATCEAIDLTKLTEVMEEALAKTEQELGRAHARVERAEAATRVVTRNEQGER